MRNATQQKIGGLLGLFAVLLLVFAPLVSQVLRAHDPSLLAQLSFCSLQGDEHVLTAQDQSTAVGQDNAIAAGRDGQAAPGHDGHGPAGAPLDACAYCGFVGAFAALPSTPAPAFVRVDVTTFVPLPGERIPLARPPARHALARAPPLHV